MADEKFGFWHFLHVNPLIKYALLFLIIVSVLYCLNKGYSINTNGLNAPADTNSPGRLKDLSLEAKKTDTSGLLKQLKHPDIAKKPLVTDTSKPTMGSVSRVKDLNSDAKLNEVGSNENGKKLRGVQKIDTLKQAPKYLFTGPVTQSAVGDNASVTNNNYEPIPRTLTEADAMDILSSVEKIISENKDLDKSTTIQYFMAVQDKEASNYADQIYSWLKFKGYDKAEPRYAIFTGIRTNNFEVTKSSENGKKVAINIFSQKSVATR